MLAAAGRDAHRRAAPKVHRKLGGYAADVAYLMVAN